VNAAPLLVSLFAVYLMAAASPGPNTFIVTRLALAAGRRPAALAVAGVATGNACWLVLVLGWSQLLFDRVPELARLLRVGGAVYLGGLGLHAFWQAWHGRDLLSRAGTEGAPPGASSFRSGVITSLTNPNTLPFYISLFAATLGPRIPAWVRYAAAGGVLVLCVLWYGGLALGFSTELVQRGYRRWAGVINYALAVALIAFAARLLEGLG